MPPPSKYAPLGQYLREHAGLENLNLTFAEIERLLGFPLPASKRFPAWWSNNPSNNPMTKVWLDAGFETEQVDIPGEKLVFRNVAKARRELSDAFSEAGVDLTPSAEVAEEPRAFQHAEGKPLPPHPAIGFLKGTFTIEPGWDLTKPSLDPEELAEWEANLDRKADLYESGLRDGKSGDKR